MIKTKIIIYLLLPEQNLCLMKYSDPLLFGIITVMKKILWITGILVFASAMAMARADDEPTMSVNFVPTPRLIAPMPHDEVLDLSGKESATFEWSMEGDVTQREYYDFRIYKGLDAVASALVYKQRLASYKISVKSDLFQNGQRYTWAVRQVYKNGAKSRRDFSSFLVKK